MIGDRVYHQDGVTVGFIEDERAVEGEKQYWIDWSAGLPREWMRTYWASLEPRPAVVHTAANGRQLTPAD